MSNSILKKISLSKQTNKNLLALILGLSFLGSFAIPFTYVSAQGQEFDPNTVSLVNSNAPTDLPSIEGSLPDCLSLGVVPTSLTGCFANIVFYIIFTPSTWFISVAGDFFDYMVFFSLDKRVIDSEFANGGWTLTRDLANIGFIFILLYVALRKILQAGGYALQSIITKLIIIALLVNFSLFFTKVVIDASNILALGFYNNITAQEIAVEGTLVPRKNISLSLINGINIQAAISTESFEDLATEKWEKNLGIALVILFAAAAMLIGTYALAVVGVLFLMRTIALWFLMIAAPIAFLAWIMPSETNNYAQKWWKALLHQSFLAPLFLFFLFLMIKFIVDTNMLDTISFASTEEVGISEALLGVLVRMSVIIGILFYAVKVTKELSDKTASRIVGGITSTARGAGGLVLGGLGGWALRGTVGRGASILAARKDFQDASKEKGFRGVATRLALKATQKTATSSFDVRATKIGEKALQGKVGGIRLGGKGGGKGGHEAALEKQIKTKEKFGATLGERNQEDYYEAIAEPVLPGSLFNWVTRKNKVASAKYQLKEAEKDEKKNKEATKNNDQRIERLEDKDKSPGEKMRLLSLQEKRIKLRGEKEDIKKRIEQNRIDSSTIGGGKKDSGGKKDDDKKDDDKKEAT